MRKLFRHVCIVEKTTVCKTSTQMHALRCAFYSQIPDISLCIRSKASALRSMYAECNVAPS